MSLIELRNIKKTYVEKSGISTEALRGVDLLIAEGEFTSIAGPSGSGKTTLLNIIGALDLPTEGKVMIDGQDITETPVHRLSYFRLTKVGFVFQAYNLFNSLTALENVEYVMLLRKVKKVERQKKAMDVLEKVGLADLAEKRPNQLSGGQQQRVAIARALASDPKFILADEPTANLDSKTSGDLLDFMKDLNTTNGTTFIFSTHDKLVMEKANRLIRIKDGRIEG
jgi:putative ABC transport system ATP-binding protein